MKTVRIYFTDFWPGFDQSHNFIMDELKKKYKLEIDSQNPQYLFYSVFGNDFLNYSCVRIFRTGEACVPDFNVCDYALGFDYINFGDRYLRYPSCIMKPLEFYHEIENRKDIKIENLNKRKFCNFVYSNANASSFRKELFEKLSKYKKVDSGGRYLNNIGDVVQDKIEFQKQYKFTIACENSIYDGYTTEKLMDALYAHTIPIYWGNPRVSEDFNTNAFIDCSQYDNIDDIVKRVIAVDCDNALYINMMKETAVNFEIEKRKREFIEYLYYIIDQPYDKAFRRNQSYWGKEYESRRKNEIKCTKIITNFRKMINATGVLKVRRLIREKKYRKKEKKEN